MKLMPLLFVCLALGAPVATPAAAVVQQEEQKAAAAMELARMVMPLHEYVERELRLGRMSFEALPTTDEDAKAIEEEYPGFYRYLWSAVEPEMRRYVTEDHPKLLRLFADLYQSQLTGAEIAAIRTFYSTPTGQRVLKTMYRDVDMSPLVEQMAADPEKKVSAEALSEVQRNARAQVIAESGPQDRAAAEALVKAVPVKKLQVIAGEVAALTLKMANESDPEFEARIQKIMSAALERYSQEKGSGAR